MKNSVKISIKLLIISLLVFIRIATSYAQDYPYVEEEKEEKPVEKEEDKPKKEDKKEEKSSGDKIYFGGNFNLLFGTNTIIDISPIIGYRVSDDFSLGGGVIYTYFKRQINSSYSVSGTGYGGRAFLRYDIQTDILPNSKISPYVEYESLNYQFADSNGQKTPRKWYGSLFAGAGIIQPVGKGSLNIFLLYNLTWDEDSIYPTPFVYRMGFNFW
ncbi:MAG: hypothetical protein OHK0038_15060 [Flammeovirgaceae bacterium]